MVGVRVASLAGIEKELGGKLYSLGVVCLGKCGEDFFGGYGLNMTILVPGIHA